MVNAGPTNIAFNSRTTSLNKRQHPANKVRHGIDVDSVMAATLGAEVGCKSGSALHRCSRDRCNAAVAELHPTALRPWLARPAPASFIACIRR
jgi:hypothetical protein